MASHHGTVVLPRPHLSWSSTPFTPRLVGRRGLRVAAPDVGRLTPGCAGGTLSKDAVRGGGSGVPAHTTWSGPPARG